MRFSGIPSGGVPAVLSRLKLKPEALSASPDKFIWPLHQTTTATLLFKTNVYHQPAQEEFSCHHHRSANGHSKVVSTSTPPPSLKNLSRFALSDNASKHFCRSRAYRLQPKLVYLLVYIVLVVPKLQFAFFVLSILSEAPSPMALLISPRASISHRNVPPANP